MDSLNSYLRINDRLRRLEFIQIRYLGPKEFRELIRDGFVGFLLLTAFFSAIPLTRRTFRWLILVTLVFYIVAIVGMAITLISPVTITNRADGYRAIDGSTGHVGWGQSAEEALENLTDEIEAATADSPYETNR